ncbi:orotate phosphoribosyltransferase [Methanosarcina thermophila]|jgi:orotate phosphoribosyltransferase|uniref:Orotate phosphoribosyltransferase n=3 Tax=Methanosarcina thermophila TaxID=2210 RepID=A0A1I6ZAA1_METTE|nr:orotate phosphoribosyltransferase [Methanosarcina thermophila]ALK06470.1 MAG: orotate phosphoribosyltransferase [Methanosarcina sp. 795]AKB11867.1 Orotate phosphoribosyltransferase [Methanosarcina thermophila TM-1]AKB14938.1 Orotate phosphoribosyltransferase [Methanosarcina thermophila CHTI-55]NLU57557.1 orotate phosphoribosyltransferase [Methanosarcina thermophila]SFT59656.1 orotate phosphoribosyltransferase [Methanosarcina thermophila]
MKKSETESELETQKQELIAALKACGAVRYGDFTLASGKKSKYYIDIKRASTDPKTLKLIAQQAASRIKQMDVDIVAGVELGGVPLATAVSLETELPLLIVRKAVKDYGTKSRFVGDIKPKNRLVILEDVTTSGGSVRDAIDVIRETGASVKYVISVVDREEGAKENLNEAGTELIPLVSASDLLK